MTVQELISVLKDLGPEAEVQVWDAYWDTLTKEVDIKIRADGTILISTWRE